MILAALVCTFSGFAQGQDGTFSVRKTSAHTESEVRYLTPDDLAERFAGEDLMAVGQPVDHGDGAPSFPYETPEGKLSGLYKISNSSSKISSENDSTYSDTVEYLRFYPDGKVYYIKSVRTPKRVDDLIEKRPHKLNRQRGTYLASKGSLKINFDHYLRQQNYELEFEGGQPEYGSIKLKRSIRQNGDQKTVEQLYKLCRFTDEW